MLPGYISDISENLIRFSVSTPLMLIQRAECDLVNRIRATTRKILFLPRVKQPSFDLLEQKLCNRLPVGMKDSSSLNIFYKKISQIKICNF